MDESSEERSERHGSRDLREATTSGLGWNFLGRLSTRVLSFVFSVILARILFPEDFGVVGMVLIFLSFGEILLDLGLSTAVVQREDLGERHLSSVFWFHVSLGVGLFGLFSLSGPLLARFYETPTLVQITPVMACVFLLVPFALVPQALLRRRMRFREHAIIDATAPVGAAFAAVLLAVTGFGVWSLALEMVFHSLITVTLCWFFVSWVPRFSFDWDAFRELLYFSLNHTGYRITNYWVRQSDDLIVGKGTGAEVLGYYRRGYSLMQLPVKLVTEPARRVMESVLSSIQDEVSRVREIFLKANQLLAFATLPMMAGMIVVAPEFIVALIGEKWIETVPILRVLAVAGLIQPLKSSTGWVFVSQGRTDWQFYWSLLELAVFVVAFSIGIQWGGYGVAVGYTVGLYALWIPLLFLVGVLLEMSVIRYLVSLWRSAFVSLLMVGIVLIYRPLLLKSVGITITLILEILVGFLAYGGLSYLLNRELYGEFSDLARSFLDRKSSESNE